jgi:hypothetical protein
MNAGAEEFEKGLKEFSYYKSFRVLPLIRA